MRIESGLPTSPIRVLTLDHHFSSARGGVGTFNVQLCRALSRAGSEVHSYVVDFGPAELDEAQRNMVRLIEADPLPGRPPDEWLAVPPATFLNLAPHLIIGHGRVSGGQALEFRDRYFERAAYLHIVHTNSHELEWYRDPDENPLGRNTETKWQDELSLMRRADRVMAVGPWLSEVTQRSLRALAMGQKAVRLDPGFDAYEREPTTPATDSFRVMITGRLKDHRIKGLDIAACAVGEAIELVGPRGRRLELYLRGAEQGKILETRQRVIDWSGRPGLMVSALEYTSDPEVMKQDLRTSELVLLPSRTEGFGLVAAEAIAAGVPVLISERSGLAMMLEEEAPNDARDMVVPVEDHLSRDAQRWGEAIARVLKDPRAAFARAADLSERLRACHTWVGAAQLVRETTSVMPRWWTGVPDHPNHLSALLCTTGRAGRDFKRELRRRAGGVIDHVSPFDGIDLDERDLPTSDAMETVISQADVVLFVLTDESGRRTPANPCVPLLDLARIHDRPIVVLQVSFAASPPVWLPEDVATVDFTGDLVDGIGELAAHLAILGQLKHRSAELPPGLVAPAAAAADTPTGEFEPVNEMPDMDVTRFQDRDEHLRVLRELLKGDVFRLILLKGDNGTGKTALLRKLRDDPPEAPRGFVYFSARGYRWITVPTLLEDLVRAVGGADSGSAPPDASAETSWRESVDRVVAVLNRRPVVVVIDDADALFDDAGEWKDRELRELLTALAARQDHAVKVIMSIGKTRRGRPGDPAFLRSATPHSLDRGLAPDFADKLLLSLDLDHRLAAWPRSMRRKILDRSGGHPRAVELVAGAVRKHPNLTAHDVLSVLMAPGDAAANLHRYLFDRLELDERRVMQALAVFSRPVPVEAVTFLLEELVPAIQTEIVLRTLRGWFLVHSYREHYYLPNADTAFVLSTLLGRDAPSSGALDRETLWLRGAEYFQTLREGRTRDSERLEDLWPELGQIELFHRAHRWRQALEVMNDIDVGFLTSWGQSHVLTSWREDLRKHLQDDSLAGLNLSSLIAARRQYEGRAEDIEDVMIALRHAESANDHVNITVVTVQLANALFDAGRIAEAAGHFRHAIRQSQILHLYREEIDARVGNASCLTRNGQFADAEEELRAAFAVTERYDPTFDRDETRAHVLINRAWLARQRGDYWLDRGLLDLALERATGLGATLLHGLVLNGLASNALITTQPERAAELTAEAARIGVRMDNHRLLREAAVAQCLAHLDLGDLPAAALAAETAVRYATRPSALGALGVHGLVAYLQGEDEAATQRFERALRLVPERRNDASSQDVDYHLLNAAGVARCGLALLGRRPAAEAVEAFEAARRTAAEPGVLAYNDVVLRQFRLRDENLIPAEVHWAACGPGFGGPAMLNQFRP